MGCKSIEVSITTPARLHFGIVDMRGDLGRIHGSVGVAIMDPHLNLRATKSDKIEVHGNRSVRAQYFAEKILNDHGINGGVCIRIDEDIPEHIGFGSGTQLALSIGTAVAKLYSLDLSAEEIAIKLERSQVSGIGTHGFLHGGFIVDAGHALNRREEVAPMLFRTDVPEDWIFVVGIPNIDKGFSGEQEQNAFNKLEPPPAKVVAEVSRLVLIQMIPSIIDKDIALFGDAMTRLDTMFGDYWLEIQGGRYSHPRIEEGVNFLLNNGAFGAGQSSWGPAFYGLAEGKHQARELADNLNEFLNTANNSGKAFITGANNKGADIKIK